jgi:hypothetical protein
MKHDLPIWLEYAETHCFRRMAFFPILISFPEKTPAPKGKHFKFSTPITHWNIGSSRGGIEHHSTPTTVEKVTYLPSP